MSRIVRFIGSPPGTISGYGVRGPRHPEFAKVWWIDWLGGATPGNWYDARMFINIGTAFIE